MDGNENTLETREDDEPGVTCWGCGQPDRGIVCGPCMAVVSEAMTILQNILGGYANHAR